MPYSRNRLLLPFHPTHKRQFPLPPKCTRISSSPPFSFSDFFSKGFLARPAPLPGKKLYNQKENPPTPQFPQTSLFSSHRLLLLEGITTPRHSPLYPTILASGPPLHLPSQVFLEAYLDLIADFTTVSLVIGRLSWYYCSDRIRVTPINALVCACLKCGLPWNHFLLSFFFFSFCNSSIHLFDSLRALNAAFHETSCQESCPFLYWDSGPRIIRVSRRDSFFRTCQCRSSPPPKFADESRWYFLFFTPSATRREIQEPRRLLLSYPPLFPYYYQVIRHPDSPKGT